MPLIQVPDHLHAKLKTFAAEQDTTMTAVLRAALDAFFASAPQMLRARNWFVKMYLWDDGALEHESELYEIESTGELPELAERFLKAPGVAELVRADLPRLRQVLARVQSTSARIANNDGSQMLQIDVFRDRPEEPLTR